MPKHTTMSEIDRMVTGIEVQAAVDLVVAYILKTHKFKNAEAAHGYWAGLTEDEKLETLVKALEQ
jgi:hypothetical protein